MSLMVISDKKIAKILGISIKQVRKTRKSLIEKGYLEQITNKDGSVCIKPTFPNSESAKYMNNI